MLHVDPVATGEAESVRADVFDVGPHQPRGTGNALPVRNEQCGRRKEMASGGLAYAAGRLQTSQ
jgi:hypothetical protein